MKVEETQISALTLVNKICEFIYLTLKDQAWSFEAQNHNHSRLFRLKQIDSLIEIFVPNAKRLIKLKAFIMN